MKSCCAVQARHSARLPVPAATSFPQEPDVGVAEKLSPLRAAENTRSAELSRGGISTAACS